MPWDCPACGFTVEVDQEACPLCQGAKSSWTVRDDQTRTLVVPTRGRLRCLTGLSGLTSEVQPSRGELLDAERAPVLPVSVARRIAARGHLPAPAHVLVVRSSAPAVVLGVDFAAAELVEHPLATAEVGGEHEATVLLVFADEAAGDPVELPGVQVIDITEVAPDGEGFGEGFAPAVEVSAGRRAPVELPTRRAADRTRVLHIELEDACFETDRCVLLPDAGGDEGEGLDTTAEQVGGLGAVRAALELLERMAHKRLLVAGHTDTTGGDAHNLELSRARAESVLAVLTGDRDGWAAHAQERFVMADLQRVLRWVARTFDWDTDPGPVDGEFGPRTRGARDRFRERFNAERGGALKRHVKQSEADWRAAFDLYDEALAGRLGLDSTGLAAARARVQRIGEGAVGCGEAWPLEAVDVDGFESRANRRVDLLFFDPHDVPDLACHAGGGCDPAACPIYAGGRYAIERLPVDLDDFVDPDAPFELWARLLDREGAAPLTGVAWRVDLGGGRVEAGVTDAEGELRVSDVPVGHFFLQVEAKGAHPATISSLRSPRAPALLRLPGVASPVVLPGGADDLPSLPDSYQPLAEEELYGIEVP